MLDSRIEARRVIPMLGLLLALATVASGCIADETILEPAIQAVQIPSSCQRGLDEGIVDELTTGEPCMGSLSCGRSDWCTGYAADCTEGTDLAIHEVSVLECPVDHNTRKVLPTEGETVDDCEAALHEGKSGQACTTSFTCGRVADACCAEVATCGLKWPDLSEDGLADPSQRLIRMRICTSDCQNVAIDDSPVATDCASAGWQEDPYTLALGRPCTGDFVCMDGVDISEGGVPQALGVSPDLAFCASGIVLGRPGALQPPSLGSLL